IQGAEEAWQVKEQIAAAKVALMLNPYNNLPSEFETIGNRIDQMTVLHEAGIPLMISNDTSHNAYVIRQIAGNAVAHGLPWEDALASITKVPAQWFGLGAEFGTLETGMKANLVVWDGDPLETTTSAEQVFIDGKSVSMSSRQTKLRDRYMSDDENASGYRF
ncbi:MAG: amidohydrolase family protein, partial [Gammaproteobacteria bacterium]|nr:amidohydrolase family protein [Gammaproteobacteria bacterium]NNJ71865.1 amidohydrolase family protein [Enterobacterales bacterium]